MYRIILVLSFCFASFLVADEIEPVPAEELSNIKIDPLMFVKEQIAQACAKGWNYSAQNKAGKKQTDDSGVEFTFRVIPPSNNSMQKSEAITLSSESDFSKRQAEELCR